jgi:hypothetical protein
MDKLRGKIDKDGIIWNERCGVMKKQRCINNPDTYCGDWCPAFGCIMDWVSWRKYMDSTPFTRGEFESQHIVICAGRVNYSKLIDERRRDDVCTVHE